MNTARNIHPELQPFACKSGMFDVEPSEMDLDVGKRGKFINPTCVIENDEFTIVAIQKNYRGEVCYRVVHDSDKAKFGKVARPSEITIY